MVLFLESFSIAFFRGNMAESEILKREDGAVLLVNPAFQQAVTQKWFDPEYWGSQALPVGSGGRGGAWFIDAADNQLVLREYLRGGLVSHLSRRTYAYFGEQHVRSFAEFRILNHMAALALPVPLPVAAWYKKVSRFGYRAAIVIERIPRAVPLADRIGKLDSADWSQLGNTVRRFHDAGVRHADLNCFNVLVVDNEFFLIDFDKGRIMPKNASRSRWQEDNLNRFSRSLRKVASDAVLRQVWDAFLQGYKRSMSS